MHQPFYKDLVTGEYRLPWTRLHALKDYYGMVRILEEFPSIRQTFNLVPSMVVQVEEYARGAAKDPFLALALKPAETLTPGDREFLLRNFFLAHPPRMIYRFPRYGELYTNCQAGKSFDVQDYRDLQVLSQLAWFDEDIREKDPEVRRLMERGRNYSVEDQALMGRKQTEICSLMIPQYAKMARAGQIEISTTPFYHPILPLICDSDIGGESHPGLPLPPRFRYPGDALLQLTRAREYMEQTFGVAPVGLWPSEGSISDEALHIAAAAGFRWAATDNGVLGKTLGRAATPEFAYRPYVWEQSGNSMQMIFRDHMLSDLIGFVYSGMGAEEAASDFLRRIRENCAGILATGRDALVPIILDGENAWEYYDRNGRPFFRALYGGIQADPGMEALTVSEACARVASAAIDHIWPGSWINANFDVWIGAEEDNRAWELLLEARRAYDAASDASDDGKKLALEELLIAEGSDWNWWYGPEHDSPNRLEFDALYREHLTNVYLALGTVAPVELSHQILRMRQQATYTPPTGPVIPPDWSHAAVYEVDSRSGSMHGKRELVRSVRYGAGDGRVFLQIEFAADVDRSTDLEIRIGPDMRIRVGDLQAAGKVAELAVPFFGKFCLSFWEDGLPVETIPPEGEFYPAERVRREEFLFRSPSTRSAATGVLMEPVRISLLVVSLP